MVPRLIGADMTLTRNYHGVALKHSPLFFTVESLALMCADRCIKPHRVVMGVVGQFLVVCPADATRLACAGFEVIA